MAIAFVVYLKLESTFVFTEIGLLVSPIDKPLYWSESEDWLFNAAGTIPETIIS